MPVQSMSGRMLYMHVHCMLVQPPLRPCSQLNQPSPIHVHFYPPQGAPVESVPAQGYGSALQQDMVAQSGLPPVDDLLAKV